MNEITYLILKLDERKDINAELQRNTKCIQSILADIDISEFEQEKSYDYHMIKTIFNEIRPLIPSNRMFEFDELLNRKKVESYPELLKATYFPEINQLMIPDNEKVRLDNVARSNCRYYISSDNLSKLHITIDDLKLLEYVGVAEKQYVYKCPYCGHSIGTITESDVYKYQRYFELHEKSKLCKLSKDEDSELDNLFRDNYDAFFACCDHCDIEIEIEHYGRWLDYRKNFDYCYKIIKKPDLKYEQL